MKICTILGNRPQFIKHALLSKRLRQEHEEVIIHTGQHYDPNMSEDFFKELDLPNPHYNLGVQESNPAVQLGKITEECGLALRHERPDMVLVIGDTASTLGGALAASKLHILVAHVEAGCRCGDRNVPEEINRILVDHMSDLLFCPTGWCISNLNKEGIRRTHLSGDVLYDAYLHYSTKAKPKKCDVFVTVHREDNTDDTEKLQNIMWALVDIAKERKIVFPIHPRTAERLKRNCPTFDVFLRCTDITQMPPIGYLDTLAYIKGANLIITDSGGVQREAYFSRKPCLYIGNAGWKELEHLTTVSRRVNADRAEILGELSLEWTPTTPSGILGNGTAVERIANAIAAA